MRQWKLFVAPLLVAAAVGLSGCGTGSNTGTGGPPADQPATTDGKPAETTGAGTGSAADPCKLLTREQATQLLGAEAEPGKVATGGIDGPMCTYAAGFNTVSVVVTKYTSEAEITGMYDAAGKALGSKVEYEKVSGIGEAAYFANGLNLAFLHQSRVYYVGVYGKGDPKSAHISAAKMVLGHLG